MEERREGERKGREMKNKSKTPGYVLALVSTEEKYTCERTRSNPCSKTVIPCYKMQIRWGVGNLQNRICRNVGCRQRFCYFDGNGEDASGNAFLLGKSSRVYDLRINFRLQYMPNVSWYCIF